MAVAACLAAGPAAGQGTAPDGDLGAHALSLVNEARAGEGLGALAADDMLDEAARVHAEDMLARGFYDHVTPEGRTARDRYEAAGGGAWAVSGENIARCTGCSTPPDAERVEAFHGGWMQSPGHRANVLSPGFARFGFAIVGADGEAYAVQTFAGPGAGPGAADGAPTDLPALRAAVLDEVNARRAETGLAPLEADEALDATAEAALDAVIETDALPADPFGLLPEGAGGWTSLALRTVSRGGAGARLRMGDAAAFVEAMASGRGTLGGPDAGHLGVTARADGTGRKTAVVVFGGQN
jgi:uncharacterized protein YkwD